MSVSRPIRFRDPSALFEADLVTPVPGASPTEPAGWHPGPIRTESLSLRSEQDVVIARQTVRRLTHQLAFRLVDQTKMVTATSELARNAVVYGLGGTMVWELLPEGVRKGLRLQFRDQGPGIADVAQAMTDGWTSGKGMGLGLPGAKRLVSDFSIESVLGRGTTVELMDPLQLCIPVSDRSQIGEVRRAISRMAETLALSPSRRGDAAIVATELATNLVRHARDGRMLLQVMSHGASGWLELLSVDGGPGMTDVQRCLQDGYSTVGTPGNGLGAVKRLADEFDIHSTPGKGTVIVSRIATSTAPSTVFTVGAVCLPFPGEEVCGDTWRSVEREQEIAVMVADGLGHGPEAAVAARLAGSAFADEPFATPEQFYQLAHRSLKGSRGAVLARAIIGRSGDVQYSGIGNIAGSLVSSERSRGLASENGTVGVQIRSHVSTYAHVMPTPGVLLMHSDGITSRWSFDPYPGLLLRHPAVIAGVLSRDFVRGRDDATILVVSRSRKGDVHV